VNKLRILVKVLKVGILLRNVLFCLKKKRGIGRDAAHLRESCGSYYELTRKKLIGSESLNLQRNPIHQEF
jgi:hypothetical protein